MGISSTDVARLRALFDAAALDLFHGRADLARPKIAELAAAAPGNPEVRQLARHADLIAFEWPAQRASWDPSPREAPAPQAVDVVLFHVDIGSSPTERHEGVDYMAVLTQSFESARLRAPLARRILITDERTSVPATVSAEVRRFPIDRARLMFERMRVQGLYLRSREAGRVSVLMDSDVVVNADPSRIFSEAFDVGLTWRADSLDAPFNGGMIMVAEGDGGASFLERALAAYRQLAAEDALTRLFPTDLNAWWGDQFALARVVGYRAFGERGDARGGSVDGVRVRYFPCDDYNFTIDAGRSYGRDALQRKFFIHFKGNRKALQAWYVAQMAAGTV